MRWYIAMALLLGSLGPVGRAHAQTLTKTGPCPGVMTFQVTGATPNGSVAFIHSGSTGSFVIPNGLVCFGTTTGLAAPVTLAGVVLANPSGNVSVNFNIPAGICGNRFLQVIDTTPCTTSNVVLII